MILWINNKSHLNKIGESQELADIFYDLCILVTKSKSKDGYSTRELIDCRIERLLGYEERECSQKIGNKLVQLKNAIKLEIYESFERGLVKGKSLLKMLNNNEITLKDLE